MNYTEIAKKRYDSWISDPALPAALSEELSAIAGDEKEITDRFWQPLSFGTGGMRGVIGAGTNRMNVITVREASQGLAEEVLEQGGAEAGVVIGYDSRIGSPEFAEAAAEVLCANGIRVYLFGRLCPVPEVSFAIRTLGAMAGVMVTASHNPREYNGYKVYWADGCQITPPQDAEILAKVRAVQQAADSGLGTGVKVMPRQEAEKAGLLTVVSETVEDDYIAALKKISVHPEIIRQAAKDLCVVYTPLNGTGLRPVQRILKELGFDRVHIVPEQAEPDGNFPTLPFPNPEEPKAFDLALALAEKEGADIVLATDPDADRLGVWCRQNQPDGTHTYIPFTGNMFGVLVEDYLLRERRAAGTLPDNPVIAETIVTTDMGKAVAEANGVSWMETLTGFKFIGELMRHFEDGTIPADMLGSLPNAWAAPGIDPAKPLSFVFGLEESYGCLAGDHARDKDGCAAVMLLCEAAAWYKAQGLTLWEAMLSLYDRYGYYREGARSMTKKGPEGAAEIAAVLERVRTKSPKTLGGTKVLALRDYKAGVRTDAATGAQTPTNLPTSNVLYFELEDGAWACVRPSGTEPKIKFYFGVRGTSLEDAKERERILGEALLAL